MKRFVATLVAFAAMVSLSDAESRQEEVDRRSLTTAVSRLVSGDRLVVKEASGPLWRGTFHSFLTSTPLPPQACGHPTASGCPFPIYDVDPLTCTRCGGQMKILAFITQPGAIRKRI